MVLFHTALSISSSDRPLCLQIWTLYSIGTCSTARENGIYDVMWTPLKQLCWDLCGKVLVINNLLVDYELAAINSVRNHGRNLLHLNIV